MRLTQYQKILTIMCRDPQKWFYPYEFMDRALGPLFVGYKAPTRISELAREYPDMFEERWENKYIQRRLKRDTFQSWFAKLSKDLKQIVAKELNYYPQDNHVQD